MRHGKPRVTTTGLCLGRGLWGARTGPLWDPGGSGAFPASSGHQGLLPSRPGPQGGTRGPWRGGGCSWAFLMKGPQRAAQGGLVGNSLPQLGVSSHRGRKGDPGTAVRWPALRGPLPVYF